MNLENLEQQELVTITGGEQIFPIAVDNGSVYDDGSGQGCIIIYNPFGKK